MKAYRYVYDKVTINGKEYTHTIPRLEIFDFPLQPFKALGDSVKRIQEAFRQIDEDTKRLKEIYEEEANEQNRDN